MPVCVRMNHIAPPITVSIDEAARCLSVDRSTIKRLLKAGEITSSKITDSPSSRRLVHYESLKDFIARRTKDATVS